MRFRAGETGVIVPVPAALALVGYWRLRYDTSAPLGVPPHVTICYPFVPRDLLTPADLADLADIAAAQSTFDLRLAATGRFPGAPGVLYLEPEPDRPFRALTAALLERWPDHPPYGGQFPDPIPHLTVTETASDVEIDAIEASLRLRLPIETVADHVVLLAFDGERWRADRQLPFGA